MRHFISMRHPLPLWIATVFLLSLLPWKWKVLLGTNGPLHSWGHFIIFLITLLLAVRGVFSWRNQLGRGALVIVLATLLEIFEVLLYHHHFEWYDLAVDSLGVFTGLFLLRVVRSGPAHGGSSTEAG